MHDEPVGEHVRVLVAPQFDGGFRRGVVQAQPAGPRVVFVGPYEDATRHDPVAPDRVGDGGVAFAAGLCDGGFEEE